MGESKLISKKLLAIHLNSPYSWELPSRQDILCRSNDIQKMTGCSSYIYKLTKIPKILVLKKHILFDKSLFGS